MLQRRAWTGRPACDRLSLATAFLAKAVYNLTTTRQLRERLQADVQLRRLCGWDRADQIPAEATFSRAFAEFAASGLPGKMHEELVRSTIGKEVSSMWRETPRPLKRASTYRKTISRNNGANRPAQISFSPRRIAIRSIPASAAELNPGLTSALAPKIAARVCNASNR